MSTALKQTAAILVLSLGLGLAWNQVSPVGIPLVQHPLETPPPGQPGGYLPVEEAAKLWREGATLFLDARDPADYEAGHIGNAMNLPAQSFDRHFPTIAPMLTRQSAMVLYCDGVECELGSRLRDSLRSLGYTNTHLLLNGWTEWRAAGLPVTIKEAL